MEGELNYCPSYRWAVAAVYVVVTMLLLLLPPPLLLLLMSVSCPCRWKTGAHELSNKNGQAASWCDRCDM